MVASTIVPVVMRMPRLSRYWFTAFSIARPVRVSLTGDGTEGWCPRPAPARAPDRFPQSAGAPAIHTAHPPPRIAQIEPLLQKVHPQHDAQAHRRPSVLSLRIVRFHQRL